MSGPLDGVRVLDLTSVVLGPYATQIMGDLGADVIKVEAPAGDTTRHTGPMRNPGMAAVFLGVNRSKRSLVLDLKQRSAREALWRLVDTADVFVHAIRRGAVDRLGFGPDAVLARNPRIVHAALVGYGGDGPDADLPAYDDVIVGRSGGADLMARLTGEPRYLPTILADKTCALVATSAIATALFARERTGRGDRIEVPMFETMAAYFMVEHLYGHSFEPPLGPVGYERALVPTRRPYPTLDGHVCVLAYTDGQWRRFWAEVGRPELGDDPRFVTLASRAAHIGELYGLAADHVATRTTAEWLQVLARLEIPAAPVGRLDELEDDPHLRAVGLFERHDHPSEGRLVGTRPTVRFGEHPDDGDRRPQPRLGQHSVEVLREAGVGDDELAAMLTSGATVDDAAGRQGEDHERAGPLDDAAGRQGEDHERAGPLDDAAGARGESHERALRATRPGDAERRRP